MAATTTATTNRKREREKIIIWFHFAFECLCFHFVAVATDTKFTFCHFYFSTLFITECMNKRKSACLFIKCKTLFIFLLRIESTVWYICVTTVTYPNVYVPSVRVCNVCIASRKNDSHYHFFIYIHIHCIWIRNLQIIVVEFTAWCIINMSLLIIIINVMIILIQLHINSGILQCGLSCGPTSKKWFRFKIHDLRYTISHLFIMKIWKKRFFT